MFRNKLALPVLALGLFGAVASLAQPQGLSEQGPTIRAVEAAEEAASLFALDSGAMLKVSLKAYKPTAQRRAIEVLVFEGEQNVLRIDLVFRGRLVFMSSSGIATQRKRADITTCRRSIITYLEKWSGLHYAHSYRSRQAGATRLVFVASNGRREEERDADVYQESGRLRLFGLPQ